MRKSVAAIVALIALSPALTSQAVLRTEPRPVPSSALRVGETAVAPVPPRFASLGSVRIEPVSLQWIRDGLGQMNILVEDRTLGFSPLLIEITIDGAVYSQSKLAARGWRLMGGRVELDSKQHEVGVRAYRLTPGQPPQLIAKQRFQMTFSAEQ